MVWLREEIITCVLSCVTSVELLRATKRDWLQWLCFWGRGLGWGGVRGETDWPGLGLLIMLRDIQLDGEVAQPQSLRPYAHLPEVLSSGVCKKTQGSHWQSQVYSAMQNHTGRLGVWIR